MNRNRVFQSEGYCFIFVVLTVMSYFNPQRCYAQIDMKVTGSHFQNFNSLSKTEGANSWVDNLTIPGWYWQCPATQVSSYSPSDGSDDSFGKKSYGTTGDTDRAMGGLCKYPIGPYCYGIKLYNSSSETITNISVGYTGEQWKTSPDLSLQNIAFYYKITTDPLVTFTASNTGTWVAVTALDFVSPKTGPGSKALNGNDNANRQIITDFTIPGIEIPSGSYVLLLWRDQVDYNGDYGLAIDDVTIKWTVPANVTVPSFTWTGAQSTVWTNIGNWANSTIPGPDSDVEIVAAAKEPVCTENVSIKSLVIQNGGHLTIDSSKTITVSGNSIFKGPDCLILRSPKKLLINTSADHAASASFICNGIVSGPGTIKVERFISKYVSDTDGWHFFSSPVNQSSINDQFIPGTNDGFYAYLETDDAWLNQKLGSNNINAFANGQGYLVSYEYDGVHSISGLPNNSDIKFTDLSFTSSKGWHLLGNPFPSEIRWGDADWGITGINLVAKLLNSGGTYSDLLIGDSIPSMNGFFIKVNASSNTITIPVKARLNTINKGWKQSKATSLKKIKLIISSNSNNTFAESQIMLNENANTGYDLNYDSPYLSGMYGTPLFYSVLSNGQELSTNCVPEAASFIFNFQFTPGLAKEYTLKAEISDEWSSKSTFILEDKLTKLKYTLNNSSAIKFSSDTIDAPDRFKLMIDITTGIEDEKSTDSLRVTSRDKQVYVSVPDYINSGQISIYDLTGRQITSRKLTKGIMEFKLSNTGFYLIQVLSQKGSLIKKVYIP
jgi:hypothetical protein